jgi:NADH-quinone oxidoreductase subunit J
MIAFALIAACMLLAGLFSVTSKNLVHSVLWLAVCLVSTAALYAVLDAPFLAAMQVMLYTGGVITLMLFAIMLTEHRPGTTSLHTSGRRLPGILAAGLVFGLIAHALWQTPLPEPPVRFDSSTARLGEVLLGGNLVAFEALSVLLLAAMLGAIVLARRHDA